MSCDGLWAILGSFSILAPQYYGNNNILVIQARGELNRLRWYPPNLRE
ncbi:MAG TPA: hypothetical protein VKA95_00560 [Nitrososphaeraceae archaeon]|nr:hypothetical protein [Nitrososphaeraceae archaeon]